MAKAAKGSHGDEKPGKAKSADVDAKAKKSKSISKEGRASAA